MTEALFPILVSVIVISLISFVGAATLSLKKGVLEKILLVIVALGAGTLLGGALFDLIPEAVDAGGAIAYQYIAGGIVVFFIIEKLIHGHHHHHVLKQEERDHEHKGPVRPFAYLNLAGEAIHNFLDGTIIAASYLTNFELGLIATLAIALHEIPQELGDFGILIKGGFTVKKALFWNFIVALTAVAGGLIVFFASSFSSLLTLIMLSIAGGGFLYIALANLIPELHHETNLKKAVVQVFFLVLGIALLYYIGILFPE